MMLGWEARAGQSPACSSPAPPAYAVCDICDAQNKFSSQRYAIASKREPACTVFL